MDLFIIRHAWAAERDDIGLSGRFAPAVDR